MSVDTPFMEPETGITLLDAIGDADICMVRGKAGYLDPATAAYSKNCIPTIGKSLILRQFTFDALREKMQNSLRDGKSTCRLHRHSGRPTVFQLRYQTGLLSGTENLSSVITPESVCDRFTQGNAPVPASSLQKYFVPADSLPHISEEMMKTLHLLLPF